MNRIQFTVRGRVQGVGFRYFTQTTAETYGVVGWVRNEADGSVCGEAQGSPESLDAFLAALREGPRFGRVDALETTPCALDDDGDFAIRRA